MRVFVEGLPIPNTNEWWCPDDWTSNTLKESVVGIITSKLSDPSLFTLSFNGVDLIGDELLNSIANEMDIFNIRINGL